MTERKYVVSVASEENIVGNEWPEVPLSKVASAVIGGTPARSVAEYWGGNILWATAKDVAAVSSRYLDQVQECITKQGLESSAAKLMPKGTVVITARGTVGALAQLCREMTFNQTCYAILPKDELDGDFLFYALKGTLSEMRSLTYGTVFETITRRTFDNWQIPLPSLPEQRAIAHILGTLDDKIELNQRMNETLEEMAWALFKSWFVDFDPVRAKMEGRDIGLPLDVAALFPDRLVDSESGKIPEGWIAGNLGSYVEFQNGYAFKSVDWQNNGVPVVKIGSVKPGLVDLTATSCVSPETVVGLERFKLNPGDILVGMTGYPGETGLVPIHDPHPYLNQRVGRISVPQDHPENYAWVYAQVRSQSFKRHAEARAHGSAQANVSGRALLEYPVVFPGKALLKHYSNFATPLISRYLANDAESRTLANLRDTLLPKLTSGQLRVQGAERSVER